MAEADYHDETIAGCVNDLQNIKGLVFTEISQAIANAENADMAAAHLALDEALSRLASMRSDLDDLAYAAERKADWLAEQEEAGR